MLPIPRNNLDEPNERVDGEPPFESSKVEPVVEVPSEPYYFDDLKDFGWFTIGTSIVLAGAAYPIVIAACVTFMMLVSVGPFSRVERPMEFLGSTVMFTGIAAFMGVVWSGFIGIFTLPALHLILWSMRLRVGLLRLGAFAGGLVGFIAILPATVAISAGLGSGVGAQSLLGLLLGPGVATIVGQLGGARGGQRAVWRVEAKMASRRALARIGRLRPRRLGERDDDNASGEYDSGVDMPRLRFRTIHLLWLGVWLSLLLTVIRMSGIRFELMLPILLTWLAYHTATMVLGDWLLPRVAALWRSGRQSRST